MAVILTGSPTPRCFLRASRIIGACMLFSASFGGSGSVIRATTQSSRGSRRSAHSKPYSKGLFSSKGSLNDAGAVHWRVLPYRILSVLLALTYLNSGRSIAVIAPWLHLCGKIVVVIDALRYTRIPQRIVLCCRLSVCPVSP